MAEHEPVKGSFSIDPAVFTDNDGSSYMYFGGIGGGQLQKWQKGKFDGTYGQEPTDSTAPTLGPRVAKMAENLLQFDSPVKEIQIIDKEGRPLLAGDHDRRFFEASWMHKYHGKYYFSYSTGDTHFICYATGNNPYGPFTYQGVVLQQVQGWTNHESIVEVSGKWYIFYHDIQLSGKTHLRNVKVSELHYLPDGKYTADYDFQEGRVSLGIGTEALISRQPILTFLLRCKFHRVGMRSLLVFPIFGTRSVSCKNCRTGRLRKYLLMAFFRYLGQRSRSTGKPSNVEREDPSGG